MNQKLRCVLVMTLLGLSPLAEAHSPIKDIGEFYNGLLHPLLVPSHLVSILVLGLLAGQQGLPAMRPAMAGFCLALLLGLAAGVGIDESAAQWLLLMAATGLSVMLAFAIRLPLWLVWTPCMLIGFVLGLDSLPESTGWQRVLLTLLGSWLGAVLMLLCVMIFSEAMTRPWQRVAIRIAGAWIGASALLVLSLTLASRTA